METVSELSVELYGSFGLAMAILIAWLGSVIAEKRENKKQYQASLKEQLKTTEKLEETLQGLLIYLKTHLP